MKAALVFLIVSTATAFVPAPIAQSRSLARPSTNLFLAKKSTEELQAIFEKIDKDGSDGLDQFEITAALESAGVKDTSSWDVTKMFLEADHNSDGVIDFAEFTKVYEGLQAKADEKAKSGPTPVKPLQPSSDMKATQWTKKKDENPVAGLFRKLFDQ